ncbi:hypothetical protein GmHk_11G032315 [Glycine max]|nr:hypothetical protein GmHk_11G032315 [Glycine max]
MNIKVVENHYEYKVSKIPFLVYLVKTTSVKEAERPEIPPDVHVITRFTDIIVGVAPRDTLVDIVGVVVEVIEHKTINPTYSVTVKLRDNKYYVFGYSDGEMIMTVWEEYALQLDDAIEKNHIDRKPLSGDEVKVFPPCVDELLGKTWALRFKYRVQIRQSSVLDVTEDKDIIQTITSTIGLQLADYDLGLSAFVTSAKRMSDQQASSEFHSDEYTPY